MCQSNGWGLIQMIEKLLSLASRFGNQFCIVDDWICFFDAETAAIEKWCQTIYEWAAKVLENFNVTTGYPLAHEWQARQGALAPGRRLVPKVPFVLGADYKLENLFACDAARGMRARGDVAVQIASVPDGSTVQYRIVE